MKYLNRSITYRYCFRHTFVDVNLPSEEISTHQILCLIITELLAILS